MPRSAFSLLVAVVLLAAMVAIAARADRGGRWQAAAAMTGGNPREGRAKIRQYGCYTCHTIPGVPGADGLIGPPLKGIVTRTFIAGQLPNTPENIEHWIQHPHQIEPHTLMPEMGVTETDSRDIAAYLYTLR
jgi:cytochrome c